MQTMSLSNPKDPAQRAVADFVRSSQAIEKNVQANKDKCGELRRSVAEIRSSLQSCMGDAKQVRLPAGSGGSSQQPQLFAQLKTYRSAKTISDKVLEQACQTVLRGID